MKFSTLPIPPKMVQRLEAMGYGEMTPVQQEALPYILEGKDLRIKAKTGSGKTAAFGVGVLANLDVKKFRIQSLVLCPTRELATQVAKELRSIAKFAHNVKILELIGGESFGKQVGSLQHHAHIVVGTPGRLLKHLKKGTLLLDTLSSVVLDEADRMLDMGFLEEVEEILTFTPKQKQTLLFSATYEESILEVSQRFQNDPLYIEVEEKEEAFTCKELFVLCEDKERALVALFEKYLPKNCIVFVNTKLGADALAEYLRGRGIDALALHGDLEQYERNDVLVQFSNHSLRVLVATDVAARGLDICDLEMVVHFDGAHTPEIYTHRRGRTARAGKEGISVVLAESAEDVPSTCKEEFLESLEVSADFRMDSLCVTLVIEGGKKEKLRPGDIVGALTAGGVVKSDEIGNIDVYERQTYVALNREKVTLAKNHLKNGTIKKRKFGVWVIE